MLVHPGLWTATNEPMAEIVASLRESRLERIDRYVESY